MQLRLTTLGAVRIHLGGAEMPDLPAQRLRFALLLHLALERDVSREDVVSLFWPDRDTARGRHALRQMLYELRQVLGEDWIDVRRDRIVVHADVDAAEFEHLVEAGAVDAALRLYDGPFLHGFSLDNHAFEAWSDRRRSHLARLHRRLQREQVARLADAGKVDEALAAARRWVDLDPLEDEAAHILIERLIAAGQRTAALQYYEQYERQLRADLDVEPLEATVALVASLRAGDTAPPLAATTLRVIPPSPQSEPEVASESASCLDAVSGAMPAEGWSAPVRWWRAASWVPRAAMLVAVAGTVFLLTALAVRQPAVLLPSNRDIAVAVMGFKDNSSDDAQAVLTSMITETLARRLSEVPFLDVITPKAVELKEAAGDITDASGRMFGADYLVSGSLARHGNRVTVNVEILDARRGVVLRKENLVREWDDNQNLLDDVVQRAARFLRAELGREVDIARIQSETEPEAWQLFLEAKAVVASTMPLLKARQMDEVHARLDAADSLLEAAARVDRSWAEPLVERGWIAQRRMFLAGATASPAAQAREVRPFIEQGLALADRAAVRDDRSAAVHLLRGAMLTDLAKDPLTSETEFRRLIGRAEVSLLQAARIDSLNQDVWQRLAEIHKANGHYGQAYEAARKAYDIDQDASSTRTVLVTLFASSFEMGDDREAESWCLDGRRRFPGEMPYLYCLLALHGWGDLTPEPDRIEDAMRAYQQVDRRLQPALVHRLETMRAAVYARAGQTATARAILADIPDDADDGTLLWMRAAAHAALADDSVAAELLDDYRALGRRGSAQLVNSRPFWRLNAAMAGQRSMSRADRPN